jgi:hypothetical protein
MLHKIRDLTVATALLGHLRYSKSFVLIPSSQASPGSKLLLLILPLTYVVQPTFSFKAYCFSKFQGSQAPSQYNGRHIRPPLHSYPKLYLEFRLQQTDIT